MPDLTLFHMPRACSFVTMNAMEEAGLSYDLRAVNLMKREQKSPEYLAMNPDGKVPTLMADGKVLSENSAILIYLDLVAPSANLLPSDGTPYGKAKAYSSLIWCSSTFHPTVRMIRMPIHFTDGDTAEVQAKGTLSTQGIMANNNARLEAQDWWLGDTWSIIDVYLFWCAAIAMSAGFPVQNYPGVQAHMGRVSARPSFAAATARQDALQEEAGIVFPA